MTGNLTNGSHFDNLTQYDAVYTSCGFVFFFFIPSILLSYLYMQMLMEIRRIKSKNLPAIPQSIRNEMRRQAETHGGDTTRWRRKRHGLVILGIMFVLFLSLSMPYFIVRLLHDMLGAGWIRAAQDIPAETIRKLYNVIYLASLINPFLYMSKEFRRKLLRNVYHRKTSRTLQLQEIAYARVRKQAREEHNTTTIV
jgi:hypothetical protein